MRSVICMGCDQEVKVSLPDFGVETFDCDCGYMVVIDRFKSKYVSIMGKRIALE